MATLYIKPTNFTVYVAVGKDGSIYYGCKAWSDRKEYESYTTSSTNENWEYSHKHEILTTTDAKLAAQLERRLVEISKEVDLFHTTIANKYLPNGYASTCLSLDKTRQKMSETRTRKIANEEIKPHWKSRLDWNEINLIKADLLEAKLSCNEMLTKYTKCRKVDLASINMGHRWIGKTDKALYPLNPYLFSLKEPSNRPTAGIIYNTKTNEWFYGRVDKLHRQTGISKKELKDFVLGINQSLALADYEYDSLCYVVKPKDIKS